MQRGGEYIEVWESEGDGETGNYALVVEYVKYLFLKGERFVFVFVSLLLREGKGFIPFFIHARLSVETDNSIGWKCRRLRGSVNLDRRCVLMFQEHFSG